MLVWINTHSSTAYVSLKSLGDNIVKISLLTLKNFDVLLVINAPLKMVRMVSMCVVLFPHYDFNLWNSQDNAESIFDPNKLHPLIQQHYPNLTV